ncbi:hypothetical protein LX36DRAFT_708409 [Colletotrichum falcatum]|nr:hypothetical protein LX36DRAFT_708409 [Colletotrichum falcatum]
MPKARGNKNLVLLHKNINAPEGKHFEKDNPKITWDGHNNQVDSRVAVRRASAGPFKYLAAEDGNADTVWEKWARVSDWIDLVCHEFDKQCKWGLPHPSWPKPKSNAATFAENARKGFDEKWDTRPLAPDEKRWRDGAFETSSGNEGWCTEEKLKIP